MVEYCSECGAPAHTTSEHTWMTNGDIYVSEEGDLEIEVIPVSK